MRRCVTILLLSALGFTLGGCAWTQHLPQDRAAVRAGVENWRTDTYGTRTAEY